MEIFKKNLRVIFTLGLLGLTIYLCFRNIQLHQQVKQLQKTARNSFSKSKSDTVYSTKPYSPIPAYPIIQVPHIVTYYPGYKLVDPSSQSLGIRPSPITFTTKPTGSWDQTSMVNNNDSLVQFLLDSSHLKVSSVYKIDSITLGSTSKDFELNLDFYKYNWVNGQLTSKPISFFQRFKPYAYVSYRYFHNTLDGGLGLSFKTKTFIYKVGINTFYYPKYRSDIGLDLELKLEYNF